MIQLASGSAHSWLGLPVLDQMPDSAEQQWRAQYYNDMAYGQWPNAPQPHLYTRDGQHYTIAYPGPQSVISPNFAYNDYMSQSDMDVNTPSSTSFPGEVGEPCQNPRSVPTSYLQPPERSHRGTGSISSVPSSNGSNSAYEPTMQSPQIGKTGDRPQIPGRAATAPEAGKAAQKAANVKLAGTSDDDDDESYVDNGAARGARKRKRIPHTAVERRYRENLNAHLDKLRQTVPTFAARKGPEGGEGVKPSKCEVLNGAIEHIGTLTRENAALKDEVQVLKAQIHEMDTWYSRGNPR